MSHLFHKFTTLAARTTGIGGYHVTPGQVPAQPAVPDPNNAANAARQTADQLRMRRGFLSNIYGGALNQQPAAGKTQLGT